MKKIVRGMITEVIKAEVIKSARKNLRHISHIYLTYNMLLQNSNLFSYILN